MKIYRSIVSGSAKGQKKFAVLVDPDKLTLAGLKKLITLSVKAGVDLFFFGGSLVVRDQQEKMIQLVKNSSDIPVVLFPGNHFQITGNADAILFLSLISGRNPELLIGKQVIAAPYIKAGKIEVIPTGYILVDGGSTTTVEYMSNTRPIPSGKKEIASCTALAGEYLGLRMIYMDAGSGAKQPVPPEMIAEVKNTISIPLVVGGGITTPAKARAASKAGADIIVAGNILEKDPGLVLKLAGAIHR